MIPNSFGSWYLVLKNLHFTIFNFENTRSHEQLVTDAMLKICSIKKKITINSTLLVSLTNAAKKTDLLVVFFRNIVVC